MGTIMVVDMWVVHGKSLGSTGRLFKHRQGREQKEDPP